MSMIDRALAHHKSGRLREAIKLYRRAIKRAPDNFDAIHYLGVAYVQTGDFDAACTFFARAVEVNANHAQCWSNYGLAQYHAGALTAAKQSLQKALALAPGQPGALNNLGMVLDALDEPGDAVSCYEQALTKTPNDPGLLHNYGTALHKLARNDEAIGALTKSTEISGGAPETFASLAAVEFDRGHHEAALEACWKSIERDPFNAAAHQQFKSVKWYQAKPNEMYDMMAAVCEGLPEEPAAFMQFSEALLEDGDFSRAVEVAERAVALSPNNPIARARLGAALAGDGRAEEARSAFEKSLQLDGRLQESLERYGQFLLDEGDFQKASDVLARGHDVDPRRSGILGYLTIAMRETGDNKLPWLVDHDAHLVSIMIDTPSGYESVAAFNDSLHDVVAKYHADTPHPDNQTMRGGSQNTGSLLHYPDEVISVFKDAIASGIRDHIEALPGREDHPFERYINPDFQFTGAWSTILHGSGYDGSHIHNEGWLSGVYYVKTPDLPQELWDAGEGCIQFGAPPEKYVSEKNKTVRLIRPEPGKLVLFPSYFWHGVRPFTQPGERHAIAFDVL